MKISVVINTLNRMRTLPAALHSLQFQRYPNLEVVVVNGPSTDQTAEFLAAHWSDKVKVCSVGEANLSKSRNVGIENASGDIVVFTDDDATPEPDWLIKLATAYSDSSVGAAGGWVRDHTGVSFQTKYIVTNRYAFSEVGFEDQNSIPECKRGAHSFPGLIGVNSSFCRKALQDVGGFDETYTYFLDESDVLVRLIDAGYKVAMAPDAQVHHKYAPSHIRSLDGSAKSWFQIIRSTAYYIVRNAPAEASLGKCFEAVEQHKANMRSHTNWYASQNMIDAETREKMFQEIEDGANEGIEKAFEQTSAPLLRHHSQPAWKPFPRLRTPKSRLRIALVTQLFPPRPCGGVGMFLYGLANTMVRDGHEVTVITQAVPGNDHTVDFEDGIWVHRLPAPGYTATVPPANMPDLPSEIQARSCQILEELRRMNPQRQFQYVVGSIWDLELAATIASNEFSTAMYLVTSYRMMEDSKPEWQKNEDFYNNHVRKMIAGERWALGAADRIVASTNAILRDTEALYAVDLSDKNVETIPFGVNSVPLLLSAKKANSANVELLFVGRFEHRKGIDLLLNVLPRLLARFPQLTATLIGDMAVGPSGASSYYEDFISKNRNQQWQERIQFLGHVSEPTLEEAYANCDVFVAPSRYESFGLIYLEAMRFGKPCIGCQAGGVPELVIDGETGLLVPAGDEEALEEAIAQLVSSPSDRDRFGKAAKALFREKFTTEAFAERFVSACRRWIDADVSPTSGH